MNKKVATRKNSSFETIAMFVLSFIFIGVVVSSWIYAMKLRQTVISSNSVMNVDARALVEIEKLRNLAESQIANARSYFLLGSKSIFEKQNSESEALVKALLSFEKQYNLPQVSDFIRRIETLEKHQQEIFDEAMKYREKQTESKIVGQFYQSKTSAIRAQLNEAFDEIKKLHDEEFERAQASAKIASQELEDQIPRGMTMMTGFMAIVFLSMSLLVLRMIRIRIRQMAERDRLFNEAQKAVQSRDEVLSALSQDFNEAINTITSMADSLKKSSADVNINDRADLIISSAHAIEALLKDIYDQKKLELSNMTLRMNQLGIDEVLEESRLILQPLAKQHDVRLQFDSVNPPVLAFFDRERVHRVLWNFVGNAIKFSPKHGKVVVKVRSDQKFVYISV